MSKLVSHEWYLWLNLAEMKYVNKVCFLDSPIWKVGQFGDTVGDFAQQFSPVQRQTEAILHILQHDPPAATTLPQTTPQPAHP